MEDDVLLNQDELFEKYYHEALAIRAICDDLEFPAEYSPIFVNIHVRGAKHFKNAHKNEEHHRKVFELLDPNSFENLHRKIEEMDNDKAKEIMYKVCIGDALNKLDEYLQEEEGTDMFFTTQLNNLKRMYFEKEYREHMLTLYIFYIRPFIATYDDEKIEQAFHKGRIQDMIRKINRNQDEQEENSA